MDLNGIQHNEGSSSTVALPVVPAAAPEPAKPRPVVDIVEISRQNRVQAAESPLIANSNRNIRSGSHVFHDEATNQFVVQVLNEDNEVIRQLPAEEALRIAARFRRIAGLLFDDTA